ncbi:hypothetical protein [Mycobacterium sp. 29Ha]|uniref:hypothetical protein n=1 Tax=Mycobacterium sp. 29Ha TaxID=2939268 RepID=UPI0029393F3C|nr:hypothetical protein [Mycobacterium sp. 29Ha]MDV3134997.1 hypothetical protein [Mycobacterium sp. 29Ha]
MRQKHHRPRKPKGCYIDSDGSFGWSIGNIGGNGANYELTDAHLTCGRVLDMIGWTIEPNIGGTRFTNNRTGHGMFVSIGNVYSF